jgi:hypothetical protein
MLVFSLELQYMQTPKVAETQQSILVAYSVSRDSSRQETKAADLLYIRFREAECKTEQNVACAT